jgi:demethylmenaquinone methyltransferase/2-methoxy-6-polyprenyl-1,4-benzoquinol methylase
MMAKRGYVREMFGSIARRYDLANHVLSCGIDLYWRARAADIVTTWRPRKIADLATGTGDLALALQKRLPDASACASKRLAPRAIGGRNEASVCRRLV